MTKLSINSVEGSFPLLHNETRNVFNIDEKSVYYGREAFIYLSESYRRSGKYLKIQYIEHIPCVGTFVGKINNMEYFVTSIYDEKRILSIVCEPKLSDYYY